MHTSSSNPSSDERTYPRIELDLDAVAARAPRSSDHAPAPQQPPMDPDVAAILATASRFAQDPDRALAHYCADPGTWEGAYVSGDDMIRVVPCTAENPLLAYAVAGHAVAVLPKRLFLQRMAIPGQAGERVLFTMGMPACGKTTLVKSGFGRQFHTVVDTPLASFDTARDFLQTVQRSGRSASFVLAYRPLEMAALGMLERALPWNEGRAVPLEDMADILVNALGTFLRLAEMNRYDGDTTLDVVEVREGRRLWIGGSEAAVRVSAIQGALLRSPQSVLAQLASHWRKALAFAREHAWEVPELLVEIAQSGLDPFLLEQAGGLGDLDYEASSGASGFGPVRSLMDQEGFREDLSAWLGRADAYEDSLRGWRARL